MSELIRNPKRKLGIIAGGGDLPQKLIQYCQSINRDFFVLAIKDNANEELFSSDVPHAWIRIGEAGTGFKLLKEKEVKELVLIGTIRRPSFKDLIPDLRTTLFFAKLGAKSVGDDGILRALVKEIEEEGIKVVGIQEVIPDLLAPVGLLTKASPNKEDEEDIKRGSDLARELGRLDVGQAVVVQQGLVLGLEGIEGTDKLIIRCKDYKRQGKGPVLVKLRKPQQDMRIDLPTIGVKTVENAYQSGFKGIAIHAGNTLIVNQEETIALANKYKMFIKGIIPTETE
ncbi:MAG: UDP-2,3-diacylglucosamine diphosphatase LpxI [Alphaproteobacteria bacterium]|nr:UDP-2,3-diacylglucosamine diphosphatase LpxI [Alphaproteobacteria bacterium]